MILTKTSLSSKEIALIFGLKHFGPEIQVQNISALTNASSNSICFARKNTQSYIVKNIVRNGGCIVISEDEIVHGDNGTYLIARDPEMSFGEITRYLMDYEKSYVRKVLTKSHYQGRLSRFIFKSKLNRIDSFVGVNTIIQPSVAISRNVRIGNDSYIKTGAVIGNTGFGSFKNISNKLVHLPQIGGVIIGDNVEIGSNSTVAAGTLSPTVIESNVHIDDHVHVAHNVSIGSGTVITAGVIIAGSVKIGKNNWIGIGAHIKDNIEIADNVVIGMGSVVVRNILEQGTYFGNPARKIK